MEDRKRERKDREQGTASYVWNKKDFLGEGTFAVVYKGRHRQTQKEVAVKVCALKKSESADGKLYMEDITLFESFNSPYITKYFAHEELSDKTTRDKAAIIMELADGSLRDELKKNRSGLPKQKFLTLVHDCVSALEYLDVQKLSHRDIKPDNILIFSQPSLTFKLSDFGTCVSVEDSNQTLHTELGTTAYMPTSMIKQKASESELTYTKDECDIWAMACSLFEGATGRRAFIPRGNKQDSKELSQLYIDRPNDIVCAQFDENEGKYVYQKDLPEQDGSYSREFRTILSRYFQLMFNRGKKFLNVANFSALSREMRTIKEYRYYCLNSLTEETFCDTERSEFFPKKTLLNAIQSVVRSNDGSTPGQFLPPEGQEILNAFMCEKFEPISERSTYKEPFLALWLPCYFFQNRFVPAVATFSEKPRGVKMENATGDGIHVAYKQGCSFQDLASQSIKVSLSEYLSHCKNDEAHAPADPVSRTNAQGERRGSSANISSAGSSGATSPSTGNGTVRPVRPPPPRTTEPVRPSAASQQHDSKEDTRTGNNGHSIPDTRIPPVRPDRPERRAPPHPTVHPTAKGGQRAYKEHEKVSNTQNPFSMLAALDEIFTPTTDTSDTTSVLGRLGSLYGANGEADAYGKAKNTQNPFSTLSALDQFLTPTTDTSDETSIFGRLGRLYGANSEGDAHGKGQERKQNRSEGAPFAWPTYQATNPFEGTDLFEGTETMELLRNPTPEMKALDHMINSALKSSGSEMPSPLSLHAKKGQPMYPWQKREEDEKEKEEQDGRTKIHKETDWTALMWAAYEDKSDVAESLVKQGQNLDAQSRDFGESALSIAAELAHTNIVKLLIENGANVNIEKSRDHFTPLHCACQRGSLSSAKCLLDNHASLTAKTNLGWTPFLTAAANGWNDIACLLIRRGADVKARSINGDDAVLLAASNGKLETVKLLKKHTSISERNNDGFTPLHMACKNGNLEIVKFLIENDAAVHAITESGLTPRKIAEQCGHNDIVELLMDYGALE